MSNDFSKDTAPVVSSHSWKSARILLVLAVVVAVALAGLSIFEFRSITQKKQEIASLQQEKVAFMEEQTKLNNYISEVTATVNDVGNKLKEVREKQTTISSFITKAETDKSLKAQILSDISAIENQLQQDRQNIEDLKERMKKSAFRIKALENMVANLQKEIEDNQVTIAQLRTTIEEKNLVIKNTQESLNVSQENLKKTSTRLHETEQTLDETRNTAYYVIGTAKDLEAKNIIDQFGIFRKRSALSSEFERNSFTKIDIRKMTDFSIDCRAKDTKVVPPRSESSYTIEEIGGGKSVLRIVNSEQFWTVPYLAIVVK
ncbi:MAG TPA: hypothetical protein VM123_05075 [archaeon]|nr:hypothetical protein [archaeon]